jgi:FKBP-type peptidyl-prolyl cis-trans isomerase SlpA
MTVATITDNADIVLHFALKLDNGDVIDSNFDGEAASFRLGDGNLLPSFERHLLGLKAGDKAEFAIPADDAFGQYNEDNLQQFGRSRFAGLALEKGLVVSFADAANNELPGVVSQIEGDRVTVDFNHPLAGRDLVFQVHILEVN